MGGRGGKPGGRGRALLGWMPVVVVLSLLYAAAAEPRALLQWGALALSAAVLWMGRRWLRRTAVTSWAGVYLSFATGFSAVLLAFGFGVSFRWIVLPGLFLAVPGFFYDLFVWQPHKGRFARARAERRGLPEEEWRRYE